MVDILNEMEELKGVLLRKRVLKRKFKKKKTPIISLEYSTVRPSISWFLLQKVVVALSSNLFSSANTSALEDVDRIASV